MRLLSTFHSVMCKSDKRKNEMRRLLTLPTYQQFSGQYWSEDYRFKSSKMLLATPQKKKLRLKKNLQPLENQKRHGLYKEEAPYSFPLP